jgi:hypothetical protein
LSEHRDSLSLQLLVEQRTRRADPGGRATQREPAIGANPPYGKPRLVERTCRQPTGLAASQHEHCTACPIALRAGQERQDRIHHGLLVSGNCCHSGEPLGQLRGTARLGA